MISMETATVIASCTDGKLSAEDVINLATYGAVSPMEFAPEVEEGNQCMCGEMNCPDAYAHITSGC
jgi:hypothetical protein